MSAGSPDLARTSVALAILAAGASTRMAPRKKQLVELDGEPLVRRAVRLALASRADDVAVVLGAYADEIAPALDELAPALDEVRAPDRSTRLVRLDNPAWGEGMASSVRVAATWAATTRATALLLCVCDQPAVTTAHLDALIAAHAADVARGGAARTIGSAYAGAVGVPAIVPRARWPELLALRGDRGARALLGSDALPLANGELDVDD